MWEACVLCLLHVMMINLRHYDLFQLFSMFNHQNLPHAVLSELASFPGSQGSHLLLALYCPAGQEPETEVLSARLCLL